MSRAWDKEKTEYRAPWDFYFPPFPLQAYAPYSPVL